MFLEVIVMMLNIDSLSNKSRDHIDFSIVDENSELDFGQGELRLTSPIRLEGRVERTGRNFLLKMKVSFDYIDNCARCLAEVESALDYDVVAYLMRDEYDEGEYEDVDVFSIDSSEVDLLDIVNATLTSNLPPKVICSEDCKGICSGCGVNLNLHECECPVDDTEDDDIDPRFAKLKELLK